MLVYKDGQVAHYLTFFPNTSFPASGVPESFLTENNVKKVNVYKPHNPETEKLVPCAPYEEGEWVYTVEVVAKTEEEITPPVQPEETITITSDNNVSMNISGNFSL
jgi:hypothetical protein